MRKQQVAVLGVAVVLVVGMMFSMAMTARGDPWSWGKQPSKEWLHCYESGKSDCTRVSLNNGGGEGTGSWGFTCYKDGYGKWHCPDSGSGP